MRIEPWHRADFEKLKSKYSVGSIIYRHQVGRKPTPLTVTEYDDKKLYVYLSANPDSGCSMGVHYSNLMELIK